MLVSEISEGQCNMNHSHGEKERGCQRWRGDHSKRSPPLFAVEGKARRQRWQFVIYKDVVERDV